MNIQTLLFFNIGGAEIFFIVLVVIMFFGSKKIPELARSLGQGMREIKNATGDIQREITESTKDIKDSVNVEKQVNDLIKEDKTKKENLVEDKQEVIKEEEEVIERPDPVPVPDVNAVPRTSPYSKPKNSEEKE